MTDKPHPMQAAFDREVALPRFRAVKLSIGWAVNWAPPPELTERGMSSSMRMPILVVHECVMPADAEHIARQVADFMEHQYYEPGEPEPICVACGRRATAHLKDGACKKFLAGADVVDKAAAWDAATAIPPSVAKELDDLRAQGERQSSTIDIHHQNFDAIYERACRETGEFAEWVRSITHPEADQR